MSDATEEQTNFARVCQVTVELFPQALRDVLQLIKHPSSLPPVVKLNGNYNQKLSADQISILHDLRTDGNYDRCDTSMLCILYRNLPGVKVKPTMGWGKSVQRFHINLGDDVERIRESRNRMFGHVQAATLTNNVFAAFMQEATEILGRFDSLHGGSYPTHPAAGSYVTKLFAIENKVMDSKAYNDLKQELRNAKAAEAQIQTTLMQLQTSLSSHTSQLIEIQNTVSNLQNDVSEIKDKELNSIATPDDVFEPVDQEQRRNLFADDGTNHFHCIDETSWHTWAHHSKSQNPSSALHNFEEEPYIPKKVPYKLYESGATKMYSADDLNARFLEKFKNIFSVEIEQHPCLLTNLHEDSVENIRFYKFCKHIGKWALNYKNNSFLFIDYSYEENLTQLNFSLESLKTDLMIGDEDSRYRVLLCLPEERMIFNIRFVHHESAADEETKRNTIIDSIHKGQDDLKLFSALHMNLLKYSEFCFTSLVAVEGISVENLSELELCGDCINDLIIPSDRLRDADTLAKKFESLISRHNEQFDKKPEPSVAKKIFEILASRIWASLCIKDVHLPILSALDQDTLVRIYLNKDQRLFLCCKDRKVILRGGYGSGKSILAQEKFKEMANHSAPVDHLYYIVFSNDTLYTSMVRSYIHTSLSSHVNKDNVHVLNVDEFAKNYMKRDSRLEASKSVSKVLKEMNLRHGRYSSISEEYKIFVVIDELDGFFLTKEEAGNIKLEADKLDYLLLVMQSMEVSRTTVVRRRFRRPSRTELKGHNYQLTGMKMVTLNRIMRNCTKINDLSRVAVKVIQLHSNQYFERAVTSQEEDELFCIAGTTQDNSLDNYTLQGDFYHCAKILSAYSSEYTGIMFESRFHFPGEWLHGHSVEGPTPRLIYPFANDGIDYETVNSDENVKQRMFFTMRNIVKVQVDKRIKELAIIAFDPIDAQLISDVLTTMNVPVIMHCPALQLPSDLTLDQLKDSLESNVLITDHIGARGMEFKQLIVVFNPNEILLQQYLIEAFTRAIHELSFLVIFKDVGKLKENKLWMRKSICNKIIKKWTDKDLVEQQKVTICKHHKTNDLTRIEYCQSGTTYSIHPWHERFNICKRMSKITKLDVDASMAQKELEFHIHNHVQTLGEESCQRKDIQRDAIDCSSKGTKGKISHNNIRRLIGWSRLTEDTQAEEQGSEENLPSSVQITSTISRPRARTGYWDNGKFKKDLRNFQTSSVSVKINPRTTSGELSDEFTRLSRYRSSTSLTKSYSTDKDGDKKQKFRGFRKLKKLPEVQ